jgi:hypothetical protein
MCSKPDELSVNMMTMKLEIGNLAYSLHQSANFDFPVSTQKELIMEKGEEEALGKLVFSDFADAPIEGPGGSL